MKTLKFTALILLSAVPVVADNNAKVTKDSSTQPKQAELTERLRDNQKQGVEVISSNGAVTRAPCPYTCEMRGLPLEHCKTWPSPSDPGQCYVWDTRLPQDAIPLSK